MTFRHKLAHRLALLRDRSVAVAVAGLALLWVASCERPVTVTEPNPSVAQLIVSPKVVTLQENQSQDFTAVGMTTTGDTAQIGVTWSVTGGTIDTSSSGKRHYGHYKNANCGTFKVAATSHPGSKTDTANVTVTCPGSPVASVSVAPPSATVPMGQTVQLTATPKDANGTALTGRTVTWSSSNTAVANVDGSGIVTAAAAGSATITATSEGQSGTSSITVTSAAANKFVIGDRVQTTDVTNIRSAPALSGSLVGTQAAGAQGTVVGGPVLDAAGDQAIRWQIDFDQGADGWAAEAYLTKAVAVVPVSSVTVSPASTTLQVGQTVQLTATPKDANGNPLTGRTVTWSSSNPSVASVDGSGLVTGGGTAGSATITATSEGQSGTSSITVSSVPVPVSSVTVSPASASVSAGQTVQLTATPKDANGNPLSGRVVTWASNNTSVATVNGTGLVSGVAAGSAPITATSEGQSGTASITVTVPVASVTVSPASASVPAGQTAQLTATPKDAAGNPLSGRVITWASSNTSVATVSSSGLVTGKVAGSATITATSEGQSGTAAITVTPPGTSQFGHVFIVTEENTDAVDVTSSSMPYLMGLAQQYGLSTQYYANTHPSIGNYFELATGQVLTNNDGSSTIQTVDNVVRELLAAGKTWKSYAENLPNACYLGGDTGGYARKHNVFALLSDVANNATQACNIVPFTQFPTDLANGTLPSFSNIVPNLCNDAHDCSLSTADRWLSANIAPLLASPVFQQDGLLIITFDEAGGDNTLGGGRVFWAVISPKAKRGYQSSITYQHPSTLRLILKGLGVTVYPGAAASAPDMSEFFTP